MIVTAKLMGGLGNTLFQICCVLSYALKHGIDYCIPTTIDNPHTPFQTVFYSRNIKYADIELKKVERVITYKEPFFHYQEIPKFDCDVLILNGYFQSSLFFDDYRKEILKILDIPYTREGPDSCSIHVRRGDYLNLTTIHPVITNEYLQEAQIYMMNKGVKYFIVASDDIEWCKKSMPMFYNGQYYFLENNSEVEDLSVSSDCENSIGSNSSFSWWIYYLNRNENKIGIFPKKWFGAAMPHDTKDLIMPSMILM